jgi:5-deoxy-glucuronate isomerase
MTHLLRPGQNSTRPIEITVESAGWKFLTFGIVALKRGETASFNSGGRELAVVPLSGRLNADVSGKQLEIGRRGVFIDLPQILYAPPGSELRIRAATDCEFAIGGAPAHGRYPARVIRPREIRSEIRGGGSATRQVNHLLSHPLPAERLILYEVVVPGGHWAGWPPHCHDGYGNSPYLEETYYFRIDPSHAFGFHRNWTIDCSFDETFTVHDGDVVLVTRGFHSTVAAPNSRLYFLNYLAGDLYDEARATPPFDEPSYAWIKQDWNANRTDLPLHKAD